MRTRDEKMMIDRDRYTNEDMEEDAKANVSAEAKPCFTLLIG